MSSKYLDAKKQARIRVKKMANREEDMKQTMSNFFDKNKLYLNTAKDLIVKQPTIRNAQHLDSELGQRETDIASQETQPL